MWRWGRCPFKAAAGGLGTSCTLPHHEELPLASPVWGAAQSRLVSQLPALQGDLFPNWCGGGNLLSPPPCADCPPLQKRQVGPSSEGRARQGRGSFSRGGLPGPPAAPPPPGFAGGMGFSFRGSAPSSKACQRSYTECMKAVHVYARNRKLKEHCIMLGGLVKMLKKKYWMIHSLNTEY